MHRTRKEKRQRKQWFNNRVIKHEKLVNHDTGEITETITERIRGHLCISSRIVTTLPPHLQTLMNEFMTVLNSPEG